MSSECLMISIGDVTLWGLDMQREHSMGGAVLPWGTGYFSSSQPLLTAQLGVRPSVVFVT